MAFQLRLTIVVRGVAHVLGHLSTGGGLVSGVRVLRDQVVGMLELDELVTILDSVVDTTVTDGNTAKVDLGGGALVEVQDSIGPGRNIVTAIALTGHNQLASHKLGEKCQPVVVESDKIISSIHTGLGRVGAEGEANVLGLIQENDVGMSIPSIDVGRQLTRVVTLGGTS